MFPEGMAIDGPGNLYLDDVNNGLIAKLDYVDPPSMSFRTATLQGVADGQDGPQLIAIQNNGTAAMTFSSIAPFRLVFPAGCSDDLHDFHSIGHRPAPARLLSTFNPRGPVRSARRLPWWTTI